MEYNGHVKCLQNLITYEESLSLPLRMILMIVTQWILFLVPGILMIMNKEKISSLGFRKEKVLLQIGIGLLVAISMSLVFTVFPILLGFKDMVGDRSYTKVWIVFVKTSSRILRMLMLPKLLEQNKSLLRQALPLKMFKDYVMFIQHFFMERLLKSKWQVLISKLRKMDKLP